MRLQTKIDKITNSVEERATGNSIETRILPLPAHELKTITKKRQWKFNWRTEVANHQRIVYKLIVSSDAGTIQGLISISIEEGFIFMHLLESAPHNIGKN